MEITTEYIHRLRTDYKFQPKKEELVQIVKVINSRIDDLCKDECELTREIEWLFDCLDSLEKLYSWPQVKEFTFILINLRGNLARLEDEWAEMKEAAEKKKAKVTADIKNCEPFSSLEFMQICTDILADMCKRYHNRTILRKKYDKANDLKEREVCPDNAIECFFDIIDRITKRAY